MATITTDTYLDGGTARTAGETWTCNGGVLTVRTDTRWHSNAPASMTGSLGSITVSATLGGGVLIDGRNVRWIPYNSGTGVVPAIGTTITQGGVSGYLLGVWVDATTAPTAVGAAMPSTGFLKFREVTGGVFSAGALTGISASATGPDVTGWIEVVHDQDANITVSRLGNGHVIRGSLFELGTTNGSAGQTFQVPTNGGGSTTTVPAIWIETAPGSGTYRVWWAIGSGRFTSTNFGTDVRNKVVQDAGGGLVRIGSDGTTNIGYVPPSGCKVCVPNVFGRQCTTAARATNAVPHTTITSRPEFSVTGSGIIDHQYFLTDWYYNIDSPYSVVVSNVATFDTIFIKNCATIPSISSSAITPYTGTTVGYRGTNNSSGTYLNDVYFMVGDAGSYYPINCNSCPDIVGSNIYVAVAVYARAASQFTYFNVCNNLSLTNVNQYNTYLRIDNSIDPVVSGIDHVDRFVGNTTATTPNYAFYVQNCANPMFSNLTQGVNGLVNAAPYSGYGSAAYCKNLTLRNSGSLSSPLSATAGVEPGYLFADSGGNDGVRVQRVYSVTRSGVYNIINSTKNASIENCYGSVGSLNLNGTDSFVKGVRGPSNTTGGQTAVYGSHFWDMFISDTAGRVILSFNEPTVTSSVYYEAVSLGVGAGFTSSGQIVMPNVGDQIIFEMPYFTTGYSSFQNTAPTLTGTGTGNFTYEYQIDTGTGWNGTWKTLNGANLSTETISATDGFKLKYRITCTVASTSNALTYIRIDTTTSLAIQNSVKYPLDYSVININGFSPNSRVQLYDLTNNVEIYNEEVGSSGLTYSTVYTSDFELRVRIMHMDSSSAMKFYESTGTVTVDGYSLQVVPETDSIYATNGIDGSTVSYIDIVDGTLLVEVSTGTVSLQEIYAYETYWLYTEEGIRDENRFITAIDQANYIFEDFKIKNIQGAGIPLVVTGGYMKDSVTNDAIDVIDTTGGTIFLAPEHVVPFETSGSSVTAADIWSYSSRRLSAAGNSDIIDPISTTVTSATASLATEETAQKTLKNTKVIIGEL